MGELTRIAFLLPLRLFCGWTLLNTGLKKLADGWLSRPELANTIEGWLREGKPYGLYAPFLRGVVLPHAHVFAILVSCGELLVGAALLAGLFSRFAAAAGLLLTLNFMLGHGDGIGANNTAPWVFMMLTLMLTSPGRTLGLDAALRGKVPRWLA
jgi:thiosulfate dehydrogenase (quinone) large subunit